MASRWLAARLSSEAMECEHKNCWQSPLGHRQMIWRVVFNHQGDRIASCIEDGTIRLWDSDTGADLTIFSLERPYESMVITVAGGGIWPRDRLYPPHKSDVSLVLRVVWKANLT